MKTLTLFILILFSLKAFSIIAYDDRFYVHKTKWADLLNGIVLVNKGCTGFVVEGDIIITATHCFKENIDYDDDGVFDAHSPVTKDSKIDRKKLKKIEVRFGDANFDELDKTKKTHFDKRSEAFRIKDLFLTHNPSKTHKSIYQERKARDYAFIKLEKEIPKNIKRFKLFNSDLLEDYDILKHSYRGNLSTAGFHGDNTKTMYQRLAHIGCKARDLRQYKKVWFEYSDCDVAVGASGSPLFYILRHKKTKKIELAARSILNDSFGLIEGRQTDDKKESAEKTKANPYRLGYSHHYYIHPLHQDRLEASATISLLLTNQKLLNDFKKFKKNPSFFRNQKLAYLKESKYLDKKWLYKNIIQKKSLKELKDFMYKDLIKISLKNRDEQTDTYLLLIEITKELIQKDRQTEKIKIKEEKIDFLKKFFMTGFTDKDAKYHGDVYSEYRDKFYPYKKRAKKFSEQKIFELTGGPAALFYLFVENIEEKRPFEDSVDDQKKAKKLWKMYFGK